MSNPQSVNALVHEATKTEAKHIKDIHAFVLKMRPNTPQHSVRARIYEAIDKGTIQRIAEGVYLSVQAEGTFLVVQGDATEALEALEEAVLDVIITDNPYDYGTAQNAGKGTTRPHAKLGGRGYAQKDFDARFLKAAHRALKKTTHMWRNLATGEERPGPGAFIFFTPKLTRQTRKPINAVIDLAESLGFVYHGHIVWNKVKFGMGYAFGRSQVELVHLMTAGERGGVGWDLGMRDYIETQIEDTVISAAAVKNAVGGDKHEAEKPVEVFMNPIRFCARKGDIIMDPYGGRAKWAKVAVAEGYNVIINELDPKWVDTVAADFGNPNN